MASRCSASLAVGLVVLAGSSAPAPAVPNRPQDGVYRVGASYAGTDDMAAVIDRLPPLGGPPSVAVVRIAPRVDNWVVGDYPRLFGGSYIAYPGDPGYVCSRQVVQLILLDAGNVHEARRIVAAHGVRAQVGTCDEDEVNIVIVSEAPSWKHLLAIRPDRSAALGTMRVAMTVPDARNGRVIVGVVGISDENRRTARSAFGRTVVLMAVSGFAVAG